jgi:hypothetical protein
LTTLPDEPVCSISTGKKNRWTTNAIPILARKRTVNLSVKSEEWRMAYPDMRKYDPKFR